MFENFKPTNKVPGDLGFIFDIIIAHINLTNINLEDITKLNVDIKFLNDKIKLTSSRINVTEFKQGKGLEFTERTSKLKDLLYRNPLECQVNYDGQHVGNCTFVWPESLINCLSGDCGRELMHCEEAVIKKNNEKVGHMEIIARLQIKCPEFELKQIQQPKPPTTCNPSDVINPNDVLFVVGDDKKASVVCTDIDIIPASETESSANATCLDLSDFRHVNGKTLPNTDILDAIDAKCCKLKKSPYQCKNLISSLLENKKENLGCKKNNSSCKPMDCISDSRFASCSSSGTRKHCNICNLKKQNYTHNTCKCISDEYTNDSQIMLCQNEELKEIPSKRFCPLCNENVSWLPKFAACPKCGYHPIPYDIEKPYDYKLTAEQILKEYSKKRADDEISEHQSESTIKQQNAQCRCTCKDGKICAHCRIKKLCADIFQPANKADEKCGKCEEKSSDMYNVCRTSSRNCRPYLMKVFQELKDLYDVKETKKKDEHVIKESHCPIAETKNQSRKNEEIKSQTLRDKKFVEEERKKFLVNSFRKKESCKDKIFDYNAQRKYPGTKIGHKTCLNGFDGHRNVPRNMGWLWNAETKGLRTGWQPGAIRKSIKVLMQHFLKTKHTCCDLELNENIDKIEVSEPTLQICKKNGDYYITLRPINDDSPYANMKPIQFKITKNPLLIEQRNLKKHLKSLGFPKCVCHKPISLCSCRTFLEKKKLEYQCCKECHKRNLSNCCNTLVLSDTSESETEFEFGVTPPAAVVQTDNFSKTIRKKVSSATQYEEDDWKIKEEYPKPLAKYFKLHNCAVGQRFGQAFGPYGIQGFKPGAIPVEGIYGPCGLISEGLNGLRSKGGRGKGILKGPAAFIGPDGKFNLAQYLAFKDLNKPSPEEIAERKRQRMALLKGTNPPLLCKVDRRGKPLNSCCPCVPISCCNLQNLSDNRIC